MVTTTGAFAVKTKTAAFSTSAASASVSTPSTPANLEAGQRPRVRGNLDKRFWSRLQKACQMHVNLWRIIFFHQHRGFLLCLHQLQASCKFMRTPANPERLASRGHQILF